MTLTLTEALQALHRAGRIRSAWLPGMLAQSGRRVLAVDADGIVRWWADNGHRRPWGRDEEPHATDPATVGCLLALLREASGDPTAFVQHADDGGRKTGNVWYWQLVIGGDEISGRGFSGRADTEGAAIAATLIALAEALP